MEPFVFALAASLLLSLVLTPICGRLAKRTGYLDHPAGHKAHANATPLLGGLAIMLAILLPTAIALALLRNYCCGVFAWIPIRIDGPSLLEKMPQAYVILAGLVGLHFLGLIDDRRGIGPWIKLGVQILIAAATVVYGRIAILEMFGPVASAILTTLWLVVLMNSFNFLDNADGLTGGVGAICAAALLACALTGGQSIVAVLPALLLGAMLGFLPYNFNPAKIFMGDAGSLPVGYLLGVSSCMITYTTGLEHTADVLLGGAIAPLLIMAVPLYDTASVMIIRLREGRNPMVGDNRHFSHRLRERGMSVRQAVLTIYLCTAATAIAGVILPLTIGVLPPILLLGQSLLILLIIALLESPRKV